MVSFTKPTPTPITSGRLVSDGTLMDFTLDRSRQIPRGSGATATTQEWVLHGPCLPIRTWCSTTAQGRLPVSVLGRNSHLSQRATPRIPLGATLALAAIDFRPREVHLLVRTGRNSSISDLFPTVTGWPHHSGACPTGYSSASPAFSTGVRTDGVSTHPSANGPAYSIHRNLQHC